MEKHLCSDCAEKEGIAVKSTIPISQLLEDFVLQAPSEEVEEYRPNIPDISCDSCGITFKEFRENGMLGCPNDYRVFSEMLRPLIAKSQGGMTRHIGKIPENASENQQKESKIFRIRSELKEAIRHEDYENAANLRDRIKQIENNEAE